MSDYSFSRDADRGIDTIRCPRAASSISVARKGAELVSYRVPDPRGSGTLGLLHRDGDVSVPESGWKNHATILFPVVGRLKGGESRLGGKRIRFERNHGFARDTLFEPAGYGVRGNRAFLAYSMRSSVETRKSYPFDFRFDVVYELEGEKLRIAFRVANTSREEDLWFSCGWHPGFALSGPDFSLDLPAKNIRRLAVGEANLLTGGETAISGREVARAARGDLSRALVLRIPEKAERTCSLTDRGRRIRLYISFGDFEFLGLWRDGDAPFICVEPWQGTDDCESQAPFDRKLGIIRLAPGAARAFRAALFPYTKGK